MSHLMKIGIPKETKTMEGRVALVPHAVAALVKQGFTVHIERGAGIDSGFSDDDFQQAGALIKATASDLYGDSELIVKVKEPIEGDLALLQPHHLLFCYLHLAPNPELTRALCEIGLTAIAFETVQENGRLPLLAPMSAIAGKVAIQAGMHYLHGSMGGKGILLGGVPGTKAGNVVVIGAGVAGQNSAQLAAAVGANVIAFDRSPQALAAVESLSPKIKGLFAYPDSIYEALCSADLVVGAVLIPGAKAPHVVTREMVGSMPKGGLLVDISIDQGGCIEGIQPTDYINPIYEEDGIHHMAVTNMPGAVPRTASEALSGAILPYVTQLAAGHLQQITSLKEGVNVAEGKLVHPALLT